MKQFLIYLVFLLWAGTAYGQHILTYQSYAKGVVEQDTTKVQVIEDAKCLKICTVEKMISNPIPGYAQNYHISVQDSGSDVCGKLRRKKRTRWYRSSISL